ncbi:MAG: hypothetical protein COA96_16040 [SAR86 cluster bacterium]|uniref:Adhesin domain-containing protein n=1 Tax=SAR86 cluster bacterium TaxID=2030880 RepID=A0A2A5ALK8_9GAMM|nr:MAG: hypothetical protein COA96_16040 [SAR86 cluster bacterium]
MKISHSLTFPASLLIAASLFSTAAVAASSKTISRVIDASSLESVEFEISVGDVEIEVYDGDEIQLEIRIESQRSWLSFRKGDVSDVELEVRGSGSYVFLGIDERRIQQHWRIMLPASLAVQLDLGVGDVRIRDFTNSLEMNVGVGAARVGINDTDYAEIHLSAGVGDASIRGYNTGTDNERSFISAESYYHGSGDLQIDIEVGVGDVSVRNR